MLVDANVILRSLLNDHPELSPKAQEFFKQAIKKGVPLRTTNVILAEVFYVLTSKYGGNHTTSDAVDLLLSFVTHSDIDFPDKKDYPLIMDLLKRTNVDFADAHLFVKSVNTGEEIKSFDRDFSKLENAFYY